MAVWTGTRDRDGSENGTWYVVVVEVGLAYEVGTVVIVAVTSPHEGRCWGDGVELILSSGVRPKTSRDF